MILPDFAHPLLFAHRGLSRAFLENTMESFEAAAHAGIPGIELDVHLSKDEELVVFHDDTTGRIENRAFPGLPARDLSLETSTLAELKSLSIGPRIPLLRDLFDRFGSRLYFDIELKTRSTSNSALATKIAEEIRVRGLEKRCIVSSFNPYALRQFRRAEPRVPVGIIWNSSKELYWFLRHGEGALIANVDFLKPEQTLADPLPWYLRLKSIPTLPWPVNDCVVARLFLDHGATGIISDSADEMSNVIKESTEHH